MVVYCCAYRCTNERTPGTKLRFHKFPLSRPEVLRLWIKAVRWENFKPSAHTVLCSDHFRESDYLESSLYKKLKRMLCLQFLSSLNIYK
ncbi:unnamed protein product [Ceutorhynchus assimilis]|uniref:THAP-type domain-containing protein n=1 Tax=Ceutorhynchus assimilis TaxID=467358 RepID=A0A9N9MGZ9_9CUCU|nr:unnamed protein product [Ceutorhynchus assimilis]